MAEDAVGLGRKRLDDLVIDDESSFAHIGLYGELKEVLQRSNYEFRIFQGQSTGRWDRGLLLNLTYWGANEGGDVLVDDHVPADVVTHVGWHHLASGALSPRAGEPATAEALFFAEAIASAFDLYLVGRLVGHSPGSPFLETHVAGMADTADAAGLSESDFEALLTGVAADPDRAFEDLRELLFDATTALARCRGADDALAVLEGLHERRFSPLLHGYELSNWVLYARAYASAALGPDAHVRDIDRTLRTEKVALDWLRNTWVLPRLTR
jgi:hypothetical protein